MMKKLALLGGVVASVMSLQVRAEGWCQFQPGWELNTHGTIGDEAWIVGRFVGESTDRFVQIASGSVGKANIALALAAQVAGKGIAVYVDSTSYTCTTFPNWSSGIRHVKVSS